MMTLLLAFCFADAEVENLLAAPNASQIIKQEEQLVAAEGNWKIDNAFGGYGFIAKEVVMQAANWYAPAVGKSVVNVAALLAEKAVNKGVYGIGMQDISEIVDAELIRYCGIFNGNIAMALKNTVGAAAYKMWQGEQVDVQEVLWNAFSSAARENFNAFKQQICFAGAGKLGNIIYKTPNAAEYTLGTWNPEYQIECLNQTKKITDLQVAAYNNADTIANVALQAPKALQAIGNAVGSAYSMTCNAANTVYNWFAGTKAPATAEIANIDAVEAAVDA